jgi:hypothetical protein
MHVEPLGFVTVAVGVLMFLLPTSVAFYLMLATTVFGAASAISLPALGGSSILVPNVLLLFFGFRLFMAYGEGPILAALKPPSAGFWLLVLTGFALVTAVSYPYLFQGAAQTMIVERTANARSVIALTPLKFSSNNITQSVYAAGSLVCFALTFAYFRRAGTGAQFVGAVLLVAALDLGFALLDIITYFTRTEYLLGFVRTANYALLTGAEKGGLKRISGTFPEASAFADYTIVLFSIIATLWLARVRPRITGFLTALLLLFLILSTSATALVGVAVVLPVLFAQSLLAAMKDPAEGRVLALPALLVATPFIILTVLILLPSLADTVRDFFNEMLFSKSGSQSGRERSAWNAVAYQAFLDTSGMGAGLGSARASSFILVLLSNLGVPGLLLFVAFVVLLLRLRTQAPMPARADEAKPLVRAAKNGVFATLISAVISGTGYDLGLVFYMLAGFITAQAVSSADGPQLFYRPAQAAYPKSQNGS